MNVTDKDIESLERVFKIARAGRCYAEDVEIANTWLAQWDENPNYNIYKAKDVHLLASGNMLFLIPYEDARPAKVIIAK